MPQEKATARPLKDRSDKFLHTEPQRGYISKQSSHPTSPPGTSTQIPMGKSKIRVLHPRGMGEKTVSNKTDGGGCHHGICLNLEELCISHK